MKSKNIPRLPLTTELRKVIYSTSIEILKPKLTTYAFILSTNLQNLFEKNESNVVFQSSISQKQVV